MWPAAPQSSSSEYIQLKKQPEEEESAYIMVGRKNMGFNQGALYARLIKCLTASVDEIMDCWTKKGGVSLSVCVCVCSSFWVSKAWQRLACDKPAAPQQSIESTMHSPAFAVHHSGRPRVAPREEVKRGGVSGKRRRRWGGRGWGELVRG